MTPTHATPRRYAAAFLLATASLLSACQSTPMATVPQVDLPRFMGDWYVIANIPTYIEKGAHNAVESYQIDADGSIATTFRYRADGFDGPEKVYRPRGFVQNSSNALWGMQFIWPIKADYRITYLNPDYSQTVIAREARDYVWIMARTPVIPEADYAALVNHVAALGYDTQKLQKVPQRWPEAAKEK
jgi:apolipoprotein D and lipocalin family protein